MMNLTVPKPNFLIVGAARSGSTALYDWLRQHPQVFMSPVKETNYFARLQRNMTGPGDEVLNRPLARLNDGSFEERGSAIVVSWDEYLALFSGAENFLACGEASPAYLYYPDTARNIREAIPECKVIMVLRNPIDRAFSAYKVLVWWGREIDDFETALAAEAKRLQAGWEHVWALKGMGLYYSQVKAYIEVFPREQVGIWLYEQLRHEPGKFYGEVCRFIGVDDEIPISLARSNASFSRVGPLKRLLTRLPGTRYIRRKLLPAGFRAKIQSWDRDFWGKPIMMKPETRIQLQAYFQDDIFKIQKLLPELDFTNWLQS